MVLLNKWLLAAGVCSTARCLAPPPPKPEPINVIELPLPPVSASNSTGACSIKLGPRRTGCIAQVGGGSAPGTHGDFHGSTRYPDPASVYSGEQNIIIKTDGKNFPNGDPWKCLTCGIPPEHRTGISHVFDYPQAFNDGKRILIGDNVIDCGKHLLASDGCKPENAYIYPIRWETTAQGSSAQDTAGGAMRELRIHPDNVHIGFSSFTNAGGKLGQLAYFGRLVFNSNPSTGLPRTPRYDVQNVTTLFNPDALAPISVEGDKLSVNPEAINVGELRGFSGRGYQAVYIGSPRESSNVDEYAVNLQTGKIDCITNHPEYVDPIDVSPDDEWSVILDTRATTRNMFLAAMRGVPPLTDIVTSSVTTGVRNNGPRRFFQPWIIDKYGDRGNYYGQKVNGDGNGTSGSYAINDPGWNAMADPRWSFDGTAIAYWQAQTIAPACDGQNPLPCYPSKAPGGRTYRLMLAKLVSRKPLKLRAVEEASDVIPWGTPYVPGQPTPSRPEIPVGEYILKGTVSGSVDVSLMEGKSPNPFTQVVAVYHNYSTDGLFFMNGWENVTRETISQLESATHWYSDLTRSGSGYLATKRSSVDGWHIRLNVLENFLQSNGTLTTTVNGVDYTSPLTGT
ncbi:hypothetical protein OPT61_g3154 [Boeremia exigua]|uniref:Uncharacterized protein n=1 Tax=Boeremia exigua TaxID=749465 RepID=A0ACC2IIU3_9PLEO|nr:hypothetical protein OPT61_g3154 [Boeremia exigua]